MSLFHLGVPTSCAGVNQHAQYQSPETVPTKWNAAIVDVVRYTCVFAVMTYQNVKCSLFLSNGQTGKARKSKQGAVSWRVLSDIYWIQ